MVNRKILPALIVLLALVQFPAQAGELEDRRNLVRQVSILFTAEEFAEIDRLAEEFRARESRTGSGVWKLTMLYRGLYLQYDGAYDEAYLEAVDQKFLRWIEQHPRSPVAHIGYAAHLINHGWYFRGKGWARDVPEEAWKPFREYLARARRHLRDHDYAASEDPVWYHNMLVVAKGENWALDRFLALVEEGTAKHPYYYEIYFRAVEYLLPKWHGDKAMMEGFANLAVEKTRDQEGTGMYARIYWHASQVQYGAGLFTDTEVVWERMSRGIDDVLARYPDQWNINNFAHFACLARDREKAATLLARIDGDPIEKGWSNNLATFRVCKTWTEG